MSSSRRSSINTNQNRVSLPTSNITELDAISNSMIFTSTRNFSHNHHLLFRLLRSWLDGSYHGWQLLCWNMKNSLGSPQKATAYCSLKSKQSRQWISNLYWTMFRQCIIIHSLTHSRCSKTMLILKKPHQNLFGFSIHFNSSYLTHTCLTEQKGMHYISSQNLILLPIICLITGDHVQESRIIMVT